MKNNGFTLLEILAVLAILGMIVTSLAIIFRTATEAYTKSDELVWVYQEARTILERMTKELQSAFLSADEPQIVFQGFDDLTANGTYDAGSIKDEVYFIAALPNSGDMDLVEVGYWLDNQREINRHLQIADPNLDFIFNTGTSNPFANDVTDLQFEYSLDGAVWQDTWNSAIGAAEEGRLPPVIRITIEITKGKRVKRFSTVVTIIPG
ncbi:MAG: type II secretion system protein GspJ [Candidatus Omnitrophota bacterium]